MVSAIVIKCNRGEGEANSSFTGDTGTTFDVALTDTQFSSGVAAYPFALIFESFFKLRIQNNGRCTWDSG